MYINILFASNYRTYLNTNASKQFYCNSALDNNKITFVPFVLCTVLSVQTHFIFEILPEVF